MNRSIESMVRLVNLTSSGLLAGSLGFGNSALVPGWEEELPKRTHERALAHRPPKYFNAIGPTALATSLTLVIAARHSSRSRRFLDILSALSLAGVLGTTMWGTVPISRKIDHSRPLDYATESSMPLNRSFTLANTVRTLLGISAFVCAAAAGVIPDRHSK